MKRQIVFLGTVIAVLWLSACSQPDQTTAIPAAQETVLASPLPNTAAEMDTPAPEIPAIQASASSASATPASATPASTPTASISPTLTFEQRATAQVQAKLSLLQDLQAKGYFNSVQGTYHDVDSREYSVTGKYARDVELIEGYYLSDFILRADIAWAKPNVRAVDKDNSGCGFSFHVNTDGAYELKFKVDGSASVHRLENETQYSFKGFQLQQVPYRVQFSPEGKETVTLIVYDEKIIVLADDREILQASDDKLVSDKYGSGLLAYVMENSGLGGDFSCSWSNVELWEINGGAAGASTVPAATTLPTPSWNAENYYNLGVTLYQKGDYRTAIENFSKAIELAPDVYVSYYARAILYYERSNYPEALKDLDKTIQLSPELGVAYFRRAQVYEKLGETEKAQADFAKAQDLGYSE